MPAELKTLALYNNENGEEQQCVITHGLNRHPLNIDLTVALPNYNAGGGLFLISLGADYDPTDTTDGYGQDVPCYAVSLEY